MKSLKSIAGYERSNLSPHEASQHFIRAMNTTPKSTYEKTGGMAYFPRMFDKIRRYARGEFRPDVAFQSLVDKKVLEVKRTDLSTLNF